MTAETKRSPEPWAVDSDDEGAAIRDATGFALFESVYGGDEDSRRLVAAVNACAGIPTESLERGDLAKALDLLAVGFVSADPKDRCKGEEPSCFECQAVNLLKALGRM